MEEEFPVGFVEEWEALRREVHLVAEVVRD
jgi:hypothetical protein